MSSLCNQLFDLGYAIIPDLIGPKEVDEVFNCVKDLPAASAGKRRLIDILWCNALADRLACEHRVRAVLPPAAVAVQCTLFTKSRGRNWLVPLHQDLSIPVADRIDSPLCSGWSEKEGEIFVQPPITVLEEMLSVRVHLDDCNERNGALRVVPRSHRLGRLKPADALRVRHERGDVAISVRSGGVMLMRPLLLHASSKASADTPRRVLNFVFGPGNLPEGLGWMRRNQLVESPTHGNVA